MKALLMSTLVMMTGVAFGQIAGPGMTPPPSAARHARFGDIFEYDVIAEWFEGLGSNQIRHTATGFARVQFIKDAGPGLRDSPPAIFGTWLRSSEDEPYNTVSGYYLSGESNDARGRFIPLGEMPSEGPAYRIVFPSIGFPRQRGQSFRGIGSDGGYYAVEQDGQPAVVATPVGTFNTVVVRRRYPIVSATGELHRLCIVDKYVPELGYDAAISLQVPRRWSQEWRLRSYKLATGVADEKQ